MLQLRFYTMKFKIKHPDSKIRALFFEIYSFAIMAELNNRFHIQVSVFQSV
jgi:hypothetical protein